MSNVHYTRSSSARQQSDPTHEILPNNPGRLERRFGAALLTGGHTSLPTYAWMYYARLGVTEAEFVFVQQLCTYWWDMRDPYPGEEAIARRMGKSKRSIQGYITSLRRKGYLQVLSHADDHRRPNNNSYNLRPFFHAVEGLARLDGHIDGNSANAENEATMAQNPAPKVNTVEVNFDQDSIPPNPPSRPVTNRPPREELPPMQGTGNRYGEQPHTQEAWRTQPPASALGTMDAQRISYSVDERPLADAFATLSAEFGDAHPRSSLGQALNLMRAHGYEIGDFLSLIEDAADRTRVYAPRIYLCHNSGRPNAMPYLFRVMRALLEPAPPTVRTVDLKRGGGEKQGRRDRTRTRDLTRAGHDAIYEKRDDNHPEPPPTDMLKEWRDTLAELGRRFTDDNYRRWCVPTCVLGLEDDLLRIGVPDAFHQWWLDTRLRHRVEDVMARTAPGLRVAFEVVVAAAA